ncbi:hypothetical protein ACFL56_02420 [Candidatus Margulisiibacteriota bacterium]
MYKIIFVSEINFPIKTAYDKNLTGIEKILPVAMFHLFEIFDNTVNDEPIHTVHLKICSDKKFRMHEELHRWPRFLAFIGGALLGYKYVPYLFNNPQSIFTKICTTIVTASLSVKLISYLKKKYRKINKKILAPYYPSEFAKDQVVCIAKTMEDIGLSIRDYFNELDYYKLNKIQLWTCVAAAMYVIDHGNITNYLNSFTEYKFVNVHNLGRKLFNQLFHLNTIDEYDYDRGMMIQFLSSVSCEINGFIYKDIPSSNNPYILSGIYEELKSEGGTKEDFLFFLNLIDKEKIRIDEAIRIVRGIFESGNFSIKNNKIYDNVTKAEFAFNKLSTSNKKIIFKHLKDKEPGKIPKI